MAAKKAPAKQTSSDDWQKEFDKWAAKMRKERGIKQSVAGKVDRMTAQQDKTAAAFQQAKKKK